MAIGHAGEKPIVIRGVRVDPPVIPENGTATVTVDARSARGWPLEFEIAVSEGSIEPTDDPHIFLWHGPKSPRRRPLLRRRVRVGGGRGR